MNVNTYQMILIPRKKSRCYVLFQFYFVRATNCIYSTA